MDRLSHRGIPAAQASARGSLKSQMISREANLARLQEGPLDVLILGGGINGAGIARDLALRNRRARLDLRIGLVEQRHFASGTSGKNSQLIHGGLRYLKGLEFGLVSESLRERATLLEIAPHLVRPQPFLIPMYGWFARLLYGTGLAIYDALAGARTIKRHRSLTRDEVVRLEPELSTEHLTSGAIFFDAQVHSARFVLENIFDAAHNGAIVVNYARAVRAGPQAVTVHDSLTGRSFEVHAKKIVDATGPWADQDALRLVRGSHIVLPRLNRSENAIAYFEPSGRVVFVIPWGERRDLSLVGTTDIDHTTGPEQVRISPAEVDYLLGIVKRLYPQCGDLRPISTFSSLRPLVRDHSSSPTKASRGYRIWSSPDGVLHVSGGKYTTYRAISEEAVDKIMPELAHIHETAVAPLRGNSRKRLDELLTSHADVERLIMLYGVQTDLVLSFLPKDEGALSRLERARIAFAVEHEMAQRLPDLMFISTYWGYEKHWTKDTLVPYAAEMGERLGWDADRTRQEIELCSAE
jgi:glycerol-3-phosphate dehydrogenase